MVDKELIRERKRIYSSNFDAIKTKWEKYFAEDMECAFYLHDDSVAKMMSLMKDAEIEAITEKIEYYSTHFNIDVSENATILEELELSLKDSIGDRDNYLWISENYQEYLELQDRMISHCKNKYCKEFQYNNCRRAVAHKEAIKNRLTHISYLPERNNESMCELYLPKIKRIEL